MIGNSLCRSDRAVTFVYSYQMSDSVLEPHKSGNRIIYSVRSTAEYSVVNTIYSLHVGGARIPRAMYSVEALPFIPAAAFHHPASSQAAHYSVYILLRTTS